MFSNEMCIEHAIVNVQQDFLISLRVVIIAHNTLCATTKIVISSHNFSYCT